jgi:hypothetical protein
MARALTNMAEKINSELEKNIEGETKKGNLYRDMANQVLNVGLFATLVSLLFCIVLAFIFLFE